MSKIRALNEESSSSESEDEANRKLSKEAQEEQAKQKYNLALKALVNNQKQEAINLLEKLLADPCVYPQQDDRQLTPFQQQLLLGCLKILADLYRDGEFKNLERAKLMLENAICIDEDDNINLWFRLGKTSLQTGDLYLAYNAFAHALQIRPLHWSALENLVTISYVTQDFIGCLNYCAVGLYRDPGFYKGLVYRDLVYQIFPEWKDNATEKVKEGDALKSTYQYEKCWKEKFLDELNQVQDRFKERIIQVQSLVQTPKPKIHFDLQCFSLVEILKNVLKAYNNIKDTPEFHEAVELSWSVQDLSLESEELSKPATNEESQPQTEEESQTCVRRSRSSSDDKENNTAPSDSTSQQGQEDNGEKRMDIGSENSQPLDSQAQGNEADAGNKKKNKRDVKWWQMEGKRRSQRVRGHLIPTSPDKAKKESSFADQLKNLIPAPLLGDDGNTGERDVIKLSPEKSAWQKKLNVNYFGTKEEEFHVKQLLAYMNGRTLTSILIHITQFLVTKIKYPWPLEMRDMYLIAYKYYRTHTVPVNILAEEPAKIVTEAFTCITYLEIFVEKFRIELSIRDLSVLNAFDEEATFLDECVSLNPNLPRDLLLRMTWLTVRRLLQMAQRSSEEHTNLEVCSMLSQMESDLKKEPLTVWTVNETMNLICLESVTEKATGIAKMKNSQVVTDLFQNEQYESLIGILQSCINFSEVEKRDLSDLFYYSTALFKTGSSDSISHCLNLMNHSVRFQDGNFLSDSCVLLEEIWGKMQKQFTLQHKRSAVGNLIKILVSCERKPPAQETVTTTPWCLLHSVLFSLEREEPAFYLEEDTVPNSVLLLQMAHECMSRSEKCCVNNGKLLHYTTKAILEVKKLEEYIAYEETRHCMEQAIFCLYSYPSKKSKIKYLKDHNSSGVTLTWEMCPTLYQYYIPEEIPEFDSYGSIGGDVETLFQRLLEIMPKELEPKQRQILIEGSIKTCENLEDKMCIADPQFPENIKDIYYLLGDYYFKTKEWAKAVQYYTWDLAVSMDRFDSWAGIALSLGENINTTLNTADDIDFRELLRKAQSTAHCFSNALKIDKRNMKVRIEFGSFVYAMHAYCSRLMKQEATGLDLGLFNIIENSQQDFLKSAFKCFEPIAKSALDSNDSEMMEDELWIHHYMLGKIYEKIKEDAEQFLKQYELAGKVLHEQGAPYPSKMNYYSPPELAIEALEIYYRIHASILNIVETWQYSIATEKLLVFYLRRQENSPFIKSKQSKGEGESNKRGRKAAEDTASKKEMSEIAALIKDMVDQAEKLAESTASTSSGTTSSSSDDDESSNESLKLVKLVSPSTPQMNSFSLSEFKKRLQEKERREEKIATEAKGTPSQPATPVVVEKEERPEDLYVGLDLENNRFYPIFKDVKYGRVVALCLKAMEECISRYPYHYKAYFRLAHAYMVFLKDANAAKEYLMGSPQLSQRKVNGLFGERKTNNFFNGIWRNPIDDIDRPGSFAYHMNKTMQLLLDILSRLNEHSLLAEIALLLAKVPDNEKKYLSNPDREMFCQQAFNASIASAKKRSQEPGINYHEVGLEIFETYQKLQKQNPRLNTLPSVLHEVYKMHFRSQNINDEGLAVDHAMKYFSFHNMALKTSLSRPTAKGSSASQGSFSDQQKAMAENAGPKKRGRRPLRQASQEGPVNTSTEPTDNSSLIATVASMFQARSMMDPGIPTTSVAGQSLPPPTEMRLPPPTATPSPYAVNMNMIGVINPVRLKPLEVEQRNMSTPPPAHSTRPIAIPVIDLDSPTKTSEEPQPVSLAVRDNAKRQANPSAPIPVKKAEKVKAVARKSTGGGYDKSGQSAAAVRPPDIPPAQPIRLNTSPYKTQTTAVEQPPPFSYSKQKDNKSTSQRSEQSTPPAAHSSVRSCKRRVEVDEYGVEVIDLTVGRSPEKREQKRLPIIVSPRPAPSSVPTSLPASQPSQPTMSYPLPPKKKHHLAMFNDTTPSTSTVRIPVPPPKPPVEDVEVITLE